MADERSPLEAEVRRLIAVAGPMPVADYMRLCLTHPQYGYYPVSYTHLDVYKRQMVQNG